MRIFLQSKLSTTPLELPLKFVSSAGQFVFEVDNEFHVYGVDDSVSLVGYAIFPACRWHDPMSSPDAGRGLRARLETA